MYRKLFIFSLFIFLMNVYSLIWSQDNKFVHDDEDQVDFFEEGSSTNANIDFLPTEGEKEKEDFVKTSKEEQEAKDKKTDFVMTPSEKLDTTDDTKEEIIEEQTEEIVLPKDAYKNTILLEYEVLPEPYIPSSYLTDREMVPYEEVSYARRFDIVYFVAVPAIFYLLQTLLLGHVFINEFLLDNKDPNAQYDILGFTEADWTFLLAGSLMIPLGVAYYDYFYVFNQDMYPNHYAYQRKQENFHFNVYSYRF